jgi:hypothetical protein
MKAEKSGLSGRRANIRQRDVKEKQIVGEKEVVYFLRILQLLQTMLRKIERPQEVRSSSSRQVVSESVSRKEDLPSDPEALTLFNLLLFLFLVCFKVNF